MLEEKACVTFNWRGGDVLFPPNTSDTDTECTRGPDVPEIVTGYVPALLVALVDIVKTAECAAAPGVIGVEGLNRHCVPEGKPWLQDSVTGSENEAPLGAIVS